MNREEHARGRKVQGGLRRKEDPIPNLPAAL
jgi:hypothetical protein